VEEACLSAGAREVHLIEEPVAAAIGGGLDISEPTGHMVVDIGGGTSDVAMLSMGQMVAHRSIPVGGYDFDDALTALLRREHELVVGQPTAEALKLAVGSAAPLAEELVAEVRGRHASTGLPTSVTLGSELVRDALADPLETVIGAVKETFDEAPPELAGDIINHGILMAGGSSLLRGLPERLKQETHMPTYLAESPLTCVVVGAGRSLEELETMSRSRRAAGTARSQQGSPFKSRSQTSGSQRNLSGGPRP
jgi:rod shape-determining protein MreB